MKNSAEYRKRVVVAMSGGVDSSVSAAYLKQQGYEVIGISLQLHDQSQTTEHKYGTCCSVTDISDARRVAEKLQIPFYVNDMEELFSRSVIDDFVREYERGRTPNPCVRCNEKVKFRSLLDWALDLGADYLATGHYAQVQFDPDREEWSLQRGKDLSKDQSYFLFTLKQDELKHTLFPIGALEKSQVRQMARELGLPVSEKPDSQEICFVQGKSYREFVEKYSSKGLATIGNIRNSSGKVVGQHSGLHQFTIGQRKGLGVQSLEPLFVVELDPESNEVVVGSESDLLKNSAHVTDFNWVGAGARETQFECQAKIRYRAKESHVQVTVQDCHSIQVRFFDSQRAITPGQALVLYDGDRVLGGGWIAEGFVQ